MYQGKPASCAGFVGETLTQQAPRAGRLACCRNKNRRLTGARNARQAGEVNA